MSTAQSFSDSGYVDGLGRETKYVYPDSSSIDTTYDALSRVQSVSSPYATTSDPTYGITSYAYDALGRKIDQCQPDNSTTDSTTCTPQNSYQSWTYNGNIVTFTDEAANQWQQTSDGLGRLTKVLEPNGASHAASLETDYTYDALGDLLSVNQKGTTGETARNRYFVYDSLSRLTNACNPEGIASGQTCTGAGPWSASYGYDANSNATSKTDARSKTISWNYDALNRVLGESSSDGTVSNTYSYDWSGNGSSGIGRLYGAFGAQAGTGFYYDAMGRITGESYSYPSNNYAWQQAFIAAYDFVGDLTSLTYPDGRVVKQSWDSAGHLNPSGGNPYAVWFDNYGGTNVGYPYLSSATYLPSGTPHTMTLGNGVTETYSANNRLQPTEIRVATTLAGVNERILDKQYCYGPAVSGVCPVMGYGGKNNGNLWALPDILNSGPAQAFTYDTLNRINAFANNYTNMTQTYAYDSFGNMNQIAPGTLQSNLTFNPNNHVSNTGYSYDAAGNLTQIPLPSSGYQTLVYDAESKLTGVNAGAATYTYDAEDNRIRKDLTGGNWTEYVYFNGQPMAEKHSDNGPWSDYIYANGRRIAQSDNYDRRIWIKGTTVTTGNDATWSFSPPNYTIQANDKLVWRQYQDGTARGGMGLFFDDGTNLQWSTYDTGGQLINSDTIMNTWHSRTVNIPAAKIGHSITRAEVLADNNTAVGNWDIFYNDIAIVSANGTVFPLYHREKSVSTGYYSSGGMTNTAIAIQTAVDARDVDQGLTTTTFYHDDQIGSARLLTAAEGWPVSSETYYPFGQEQVVPADPNHYKFTGKERDAESGLDYFGARYSSSNLGRFMSPDWASKPEAVPYSSLSNPQSLNLYAYVDNNPLSKADADGHWGQYFSWGQAADERPDNAQLDRFFADSAAGGQHSTDGGAVLLDSPYANPANYEQAQQQTMSAAFPTLPAPVLPNVVYAPDPALDATATTALQGQNPTSIREDREYATRAYKNPDGTYGVMPFNAGTQASSPHGPISGLPAGTTSAALLHTHGGNDPAYDNEHFSPQDIRNAQREHVPSYLATPAGSIQRYDPINNRTETLVPGSN